VNGVAIVTRLTSYPVRLLQWGMVQWYALVMVGGLVGLTAYYLVPQNVWRWMGVHWFVTAVATVAAIVVLGVAGYAITNRPAAPRTTEPKAMAASAD